MLCEPRAFADITSAAWPLIAPDYVDYHDQSVITNVLQEQGKPGVLQVYLPLVLNACSTVQYSV